MRDYPSVPNVFRVASSHSVDTDPVVVVLGGGGSDIKTANANLSTGKQHKLQQQNGNISGHQPHQQYPLVKSSSSSAAITDTPAPNHVTTATVASSATSKATTVAKSSSTLLKTFATSKGSDDNLMHHHDLQQRQQQYKLSAHSSIERPQCLRASQLYLQSPYATLPRNPINISQSSLSLNSANANVDIYAQQQQQRRQATSNGHHNSLNSNGNSNKETTTIGANITNITAAATRTSTSPLSSTTNGNKSKHSSENNGNSTSTNESTMMGVINTISGSIPATGFSMDHGNTKNNTNTLNSSNMGPGGNLNHMSVNGRTMSVASDLNASMNNSCTNLSKLNGLSQHQHQQQQQQRHHQQKILQSTRTQQRDFRQGGGAVVAAAASTATSNLEEFTPYRRSVAHPCASMERNNSGYLWIITPVAASISVAIVIAALAGPQWLFTEEKQPNTNYNGTANFNVLDDGAFITRYTKSSLWIICSTVQGKYSNVYLYVCRVNK